MHTMQKSPITYRTYKRGYLTFYITDAHKIYFATGLQRFILVHNDGVFFNNYENSHKLHAISLDIKGGKVKDLNALWGRCREEGVIWQAVDRLPW